MGPKKGEGEIKFDIPSPLVEAEGGFLADVCEVGTVPVSFSAVLSCVVEGRVWEGGHLLELEGMPPFCLFFFFYPLLF